VKARLPLFTKVLFLAFLNLCLLGLVIAFIVRVQFRLDARSFLLAPAQNRIMAVAHLLALELEETAPGMWDPVLARYSKTHGVGFYLFDERGDRLAGPELQLPREVVERIPRRARRRDAPPPSDRPPDSDREKGPPEKARDRRPPAPPLFLIATSNPTRYWAGVRIPVRQDPRQDPRPGTLILMSPSPLGGELFFDFRPWLTVGLAVILVSIVCWLPFIRGMTRSIAQMTRAAGRIAEGRFEVHVDGQRRDEIGQLGDAINRMASRLSGFVNGQKRFLSGIAHELCTPIATIQFGLSNLERRVDQDQQAAVADIREEVEHMSALVNELLSFSRAGMQAVEIKLTEVNVAATVGRVLDREASSEVPIDVSLDQKLNVLAEPEYLFRALSNVVRNAIRYAGHAGPIRISARVAEGMAYISVADSGPGVPEHALEEIFAPFYRLDPSRSQETGGLGLGLAIVKTSVESCGGIVRCRNLQPSGLEVEIRLPEAPAKL
jgi:two-component system, OmpR family, sensor histidine kinase CpxA